MLKFSNYPPANEDISLTPEIVERLKSVGVSDIDDRTEIWTIGYCAGSTLLEHLQDSSEENVEHVAHSLIEGYGNDPHVLFITGVKQAIATRDRLGVQA